VLKGIIPVGDNQCRFDFNDLEKAIKCLVRNTLGDENVTMADASDQIVLSPTANDGQPQDIKSCRTFVVATRGEVANGPPVLFRSYGCTSYSPATCTVWEAARATSAAPSFFKPVFIQDPADGTGEYFVDGGVAHNNPAEVALSEARNIWTNVKRFCLVSIGTGRQKTVKFVQIEDSDVSLFHPEAEQTTPNKSKRDRLVKFPILTTIKKTYRAPAGIKAVLKIVESCVESCNNSERVHERIQEAAYSVDASIQFPYYRFDVDRDMDKIRLEEWRKMTDMVALTGHYMSGGETRRSKDICVKCLLEPPKIECK
jgi:predicted acylesterase/phospholipase RssA